MVSARDDLLRAHVFAAFDNRDERRDADGRTNDADARRVVDGYLLWPIVEYRHALDRARLMVVLERGESEWRIDEAVAAIRDSYLRESVAA